MIGDAKKWKQVPWLRIGVEAIAIIASILVSFSLDPWWDGRELADRERRYLQSLEADFLENRERIERTIQVRTAVREATQKLISFGSTATATQWADSVNTFLTVIFADTNVAYPSVSRILAPSIAAAHCSAGG